MRIPIKTTTNPNKVMMKRMLLAALLCGMCALGTSAQEKETKVAIDTNKGVITIKLYNETPHHRDNFVKLVKSHLFTA